MPLDLPPTASPPPTRPAAPLAACGLILVVLAVVALSRHQPAARAEAPDAPHAVADAGPPRSDAGPSGEQLQRLLEQRPMDLNAASAAELEILPRIGPTLAARIVDDRLENGPFRTLADLTRVRGIGPRTLERLTPMITVEPLAAP